MFGNTSGNPQIKLLITMSKYLQLQMVLHASSVVKYITGKQICQLNCSLLFKGNERCILV